MLKTLDTRIVIKRNYLNIVGNIREISVFNHKE